MLQTNHWHHNFELDPENQFGFVYFAENKLTGKKYIGKKQYYSWSKNKKTKKSNWEKYTSSSKNLNNDIEQYGIENFYFEILFECETRGQLTYSEANLQHKLNVLTEKDETGERVWYNNWIEKIRFIPNENPKINCDISDELREKRKENMRNLWKSNPTFGIRKYSEEDREELSEKYSGEKNPMFGRTHTEETKKKWSEKRKGTIQTEEHVRKRVEKIKGKTRTPEQRKNISDRLKGKPKPKITCSFCGKSMNKGNLVRHGHTSGDCITK